MPQGFLHWIENRGDEPLSFLVVLSHEQPLTVELSEMLAGVPNETLAKMYEVSPSVFERIPAKTVVIGGGGQAVIADEPRYAMVAAE